ncbi:MAG: DUF371 domain-containing protein [Desulfurococcaceae archaeon]
MICYEVIRARGHKNITATHRTTMEITKDPHLTLRGECIIGLAADKGALDLSDEFKNCLKTINSILVIVLEVNGGVKDFVLAEGHPDLILSDRSKVIVRKSAYIEPATLGIRANKAAADLKRELVDRLRDPGSVLTAHLYVIGLNEIASIDLRSRRILEHRFTLYNVPVFENTG